MNNLEQIKNEIINLRPDIKAEVIVSLLMQRGLPRSRITVDTDDYFERRFSRDISEVAVNEEQLISELHIHLSRTGIYDLLPEGVFFSAVSADKTPKTAFEMVQEYKMNQVREAEARKFFSPFETEFFFHRVKNFNAEVALLSGLKDDSLNRFFFRFWNLPGDMPPAMAIKLIVLLPYVHQVAGDASLMAACLQTIIGKRVSGKVFARAAQDAGLAFNILGQFELGNELTCGRHYFEEEWCFEFTIYLEAEDQATAYLPGGRLYATLQSFRRYFLPVQAEMNTVLELLPEKQVMELGTGTGALLGVATVL